MSKILTKPTPEIVRFCNDVLEAEYPAIAALTPALEIGILMAASDNDKPALSKGGYPAAGICRLISEEDRAAGGPDVLILLDGDRWEHWTEHERYSLVHHELHHIDVVKLRQRTDDSGGFMCDLDGLGRPKVRLRKHDFEIGGFNLIVERHGDAAMEWQSVVRVHGRFNQQLLPFATSGRTAASKNA